MNEYGFDLAYVVYEIANHGNIRFDETAYCLVYIRSFETAEGANE